MYIFKHLNYNKDSNKYQMLHEKLIICTDLRVYEWLEYFPGDNCNELQSFLEQRRRYSLNSKRLRNTVSESCNQVAN